MEFEDKYVSLVDEYSLGIEKISGSYYTAIPVSNGIVDYEEYYELTPDQYSHFLHDREAALEFVEACRRREHDDLLLQKPGSNRGTPV
ncbi:hypothetical protein [Mycobacterium malmoense]|uniref:hypothetical protein n=1 Tax=Mycobacterium malmoense TaxID=1780 RepID=UPI0009F6DB1C|nr:hypothetical protein [Mycobacterium malmoense]